MKKQILELLRELEEYCIKFPEIQICSDYSGVVVDGNDNLLVDFMSEKELIRGLKNKIKELKK
jgi:hypothetical protein